MFDDRSLQSPNGQRQLGKGIDTTKVFFSEILQQHGYQTGVVGKWHMQCEPKGFDYYHVLWIREINYNPEFKSKESNGKYVKEEGYGDDPYDRSRYRVFGREG